MTAVNHEFAAALSERLTGPKAVELAADSRRTPSLARLANVDDDHILAATAQAMRLPYLPTLDDRPVSQEFVKAVPIAFARRHAILGLGGPSGTMQVAISDLSLWMHLHVIAKTLGTHVRPVFSPRDEILRTINIAYQQQSGQAQHLIEQMDGEEVMRELDEVGAKQDLLDVDSKAPVIKLVNLMLLEAVKRRASDVHVQPYEEELVVRFRVDGVLHDVYSPPKALQEEVISRIKVMGGMNIAERRLAQDGRATVEVGDRIVDLRVATLPTAFGERAVIRVLDKGARQYELATLGMPPGVMKEFCKLIRMDHGIILVAGPTGSGKSTTLYSALAEINSQELNIITLEDPIEYRLKGISQTQVSDRKGMTFASGLRHVLRQDPDIIMVGEIRDVDTAHMAIQSALTGHMVFSTLHTNDAAGAVARMLDLGVEPYLLASSLLGVLSQRLVRQICPACKESFEPTEAQLEHWGLTAGRHSIKQFFHGRGCPECMGTGYRERIGTFELLSTTETIRELILQRAKASTINQAAVANGMQSLREDGITKMQQGLTTMDEVLRVTGLEGF